jgi:hypothetical protein
MRISKRTAFALFAVAAFAVSAMTAASALAISPSGPLFRSAVDPSVPTDPMLHGVEAGSAPWVLRHGSIKLERDGQLKVSVTGLIIPGLGTPGPVTSIDASLYCGNETTPAATTATSPLSVEGDGKIDAMVTLPANCLTPSVLINPLGLTKIYIASSGFGPGATGTLLRSAVDPSVPSDPLLNGVEAGSAPWVLKAGVVKLASNGALKVEVLGLIIPGLGTPGPVTSIDASLFCGNETTPAATTATSPLSAKGNGLIQAMVTLPASCQTPSVLINPLGIDSIYISTDGFAS